MLKSLLDLDYDQLSSFMKEIGQPQFRAKQLREWLVHKYCSDFSEMTNLPLAMRQQLDKKIKAYPLTLTKVQRSKDSGTIKFAAKTIDNEIIEVVLLKYSYGYSVCLSTQIGCAMGCAFCASTHGGLVRNCTTGEILAQLLLASQLVKARVGRIVLMGMGEPLHNYNEVVDFLKLCQDKTWGPGISLRHITVSTCGLVPQIYQLADEGLPVTLALSLHAPNDKIRQKLLPIAKKYPLEKVMAACRYYFNKTDRRISCEYTLIKGINDSLDCAQQLADLLEREQVHINLIPYNKVDFLDWQAPSRAKIDQFARILQEANLTVTIRRRLGHDIDAACGQLRRQMQKVRCKEDGFANK